MKPLRSVLFALLCVSALNALADELAVIVEDTVQLRSALMTLKPGTTL